MTQMTADEAADKVIQYVVEDWALQIVREALEQYFRKYPEEIDGIVVY